MFERYKRHRSNSPPPLRSRLLASYPRTIDTPVFPPTQASMGQFISSVTRWLGYANIPYTSQRQYGLFYPSHYSALYAPNESWRSIFGLANPQYWDVTTSTKYGCLFQAQEAQLPHQALAAFFQGPTFADCGSALEACIFRALEEMLGSVEFDRLFGKSLTRFIINPNLLARVVSQYKFETMPLAQRLAHGNPIHFLFDTVENPVENTIRPGDVVYIKGVGHYPMKHPAGVSQGWNVICVGENPAGEKLYLGFSPLLFPTPLTYAQIRTALIKAYNDEQSAETLGMIEAINDIPTTDQSDQTREYRGKAAVATLLAHDHVHDNHPIVGITASLRLNFQKLQAFLHRNVAPWHHQSLATLEKQVTHAAATARPAINPARQTTPFSAESKNKSFANYTVTTTTQEYMFNIAKKFAAAVCSHRDTPIGLAFTGTPGIGKTHLSVAVATDAMAHGMRVMFIDSKSIGALYQKLGEENHGRPLSDGELQTLFADWLNNTDLVVLDDMNTQFGIAATFFRQALHYVITHNKAFMLSSNQPINAIQANLPDYIGYEDPRNDNFLIIRDLQAQSYRQAWWHTPITAAIPSVTNHDDALAILAHAHSDMPAGIILETQGRTLEQWCQRYVALAPQPNLRVRIVQEPYRDNYIYDYYIHDADQHDVFFISVNNASECTQLLTLISQVHDLGKKLIVMTDNETRLRQLIEAELNGYDYQVDKPRLTDRVNNLLLGKSAWDQVVVNRTSTLQLIANQARLFSMPAPSATKIVIGPTNPPKKPEPLSFN